MNKLLTAMLVGLALIAGGCKEDDKSTGGGSTTGTPSGGTQSGGTAHAPHQNQIRLGEKTVGGLKLVATQEEPVKPGGEAGFDLVITGGKPKAVRFWVGAENAAGSAKAKAEEETTDTWHTHAEVPNPLPPGSKFWAEIEPRTGSTFKVSFDLKVQ